MAERPKRRKYRDNPYILNYCEEKKLYIVTFKDVTGKINKIEVQEEVYKALDRFELDDIKEMNEYDRHIEHSEIYEDNLCARAMDKPTGLEDYIIQKSTFEDLKKAIDLLPEVQKRRIKLYYFNELNLEQIAQIEHTSFQMISKSIKQAINNLKKILKK